MEKEGLSSSFLFGLTHAWGDFYFGWEEEEEEEEELLYSSCPLQCTHTHAHTEQEWRDNVVIIPDSKDGSTARKLTHPELHLL